MFKSFREREIVKIISLLGPRYPIYFVVVVLRAIVLGFSFNLVLAFIQMDVMNAATSGQQELLTRAIILAAVTFLTGLPLLAGSNYINALFEKRALTYLRVRSFNQIIDLPVEKYDQLHSGDLLSRLTNDMDRIGIVYSNLIPTLFFGFVLGGVGIGAIFVFSTVMGYFALLLGVLTILASVFIAKPLRKKSDIIQKSLSVTTERLSDLLHGLPVTKMFHLEEKIHSFYEKANQDATSATIDHAQSMAFFTAINSLIDWMRSLGTLILGLYLFKENQIGLGAIVAAIHLQGNASFLFQNLGNFVTSFQRSLAASTRIFELLSWPKEKINKDKLSGCEIEPDLNAVIETYNLNFKYETQNQSEQNDKPEYILNQISISISKGQFVALVGPSGGGKSTLIKIIMGMYPVQDGCLIVNHKNLLDYQLAELREQIAYVPQDAYLFDGTIVENIRYGKPNASMEEIISAASSANAHEFISSLADGYDTMVGERGAKLSGGQRQRIAITRALLKDAPILLLDEATSALDSESETAVQHALETLMQGRTTISVAHRLSTVQHADTIYVLKAGQIVEQGNHSKLIALGGLYSELYALQEVS